MKAVEALDRYLLGEGGDKKSVIDLVLRERSPVPALAPHYRALEAVGVRAADEALIAVRLALGGLEMSDENVRRLRLLSRLARAGRSADLAALAALRQRERSAVDAVAPLGTSPEDIERAARERYLETFGA